MVAPSQELGRTPVSLIKSVVRFFDTIYRYMGSVQSVMSFAASLTKRDVRSAVKNLLICHFEPRPDESEREQSEQYTTHWLARRSSQQWTNARSLITGGGDSMANTSHSFRASFASRRYHQEAQSDITAATVSVRTMYANSRTVSSMTALDEVVIEGAETNSTDDVINHDGGEGDEEAPQSVSVGNEKVTEIYRSDDEFDDDEEERIKFASMCFDDANCTGDDNDGNHKEASMSIDDANCTGDNNSIDHSSGRRHSWQAVSHRENQAQLPYFKDDLEL